MNEMSQWEESRLGRPLFDGRNKNFQMWWTKFKAYGTMAGFMEILTPTRSTKLPGREDMQDCHNLTEAQKELKVRYIMKNRVAIMNLTMAFQTQELMDLIQQTQDDDWPTGQTHLLVKRLLNKYHPHDIMAGVEMKNSWTS